MRRKKDYMKYVLSVCTLMLCILTGCAQNIVKQSKEATTDIPSTTSRESMSKESSQSVLQEDSSASETSSIPEEQKTPEFTVWDGQEKLLRLDQREFGEFQYVNGTAYYVGNLPLVDRTNGDYPGKAYADAFYMTDHMLYYLEDDGTVEDTIYEAKSMRLFAQPLDSNGADVALLAENVYFATYQNGIIMYDTFDRFKQINTNTSEIAFEFNFKDIEENGQVYTYEKDYVFYYSHDAKQYFYYYYKSQRKEPVYIPHELEYNLWAWSGNLFSKKENEDGSVNIVQLYEQGKPVWRVFPQKIPYNFDFSDGKAFYYDDETGVMEYDLETDTLRKICDVEPDEYGDGKRAYIHAEGDNGGTFLIEANSYTYDPNTFAYFIDEEGNKHLLYATFHS